MRDHSVFRNACLFPMSEDQLYIHVHVSVIYNPCVTRLRIFLHQNKPYE